MTPRMSQEDFDKLTSDSSKIVRYEGCIAPLDPTPKRNASSRRRGLTPTGVMNKTETWYHGELQNRLAAGEVIWFEYEAMKFRYGAPGENAWYTPDFAVQLANGELEVHEVKGNWDNAARARFKAAAAITPIPFIAIEVESKRSGGVSSYKIAKTWEIS